MDLLFVASQLTESNVMSHHMDDVVLGHEVNRDTDTVPPRREQARLHDCPETRHATRKDIAATNQAVYSETQKTEETRVRHVSVNVPTWHGIRSRCSPGHEAGSVLVAHHPVWPVKDQQECLIGLARPCKWPNGVIAMWQS